MCQKETASRSGSTHYGLFASEAGPCFIFDIKLEIRVLGWSTVRHKPSTVASATLGHPCFRRLITNREDVVSKLPCTLHNPSDD